MSGFADLPEHVVGGIDRVADGTLVEQAESLRDCLWRGLDPHIPDGACAEAGAQIGFGDNNRRRRSAFSFRQAGANRYQWKVVDGRRFACHAVMVHGIRAIGSDFHFEDGVFSAAVDGFNRESGLGEVSGKLTIVNLQAYKLADPLG